MYSSLVTCDSGDVELPYAGYIPFCLFVQVPKANPRKQLLSSHKVDAQGRRTVLLHENMNPLYPMVAGQMPSSRKKRQRSYTSPN